MTCSSRSVMEERQFVELAPGNSDCSIEINQESLSCIVGNSLVLEADGSN